MGRIVGKNLSAVMALVLVINLLCGFGSIEVHAAAAEPYTVLSTKDNFVRKTNPASPTPDYSNLPNGGEAGKTSYLNVKELNTTSPREAYLQFELANVPETITSAVLYLYGRNAENNTNTVTTRVYGLDTPAGDSWSESSLTWNTKPGPGSRLLGSLTFPGQLTPGWRSLDVTDFVQSQLTGDRAATFAVAGGNALIRIESRTTFMEDSPGHKAKPYLVIQGAPTLKTVSLTADKSTLGIGQTANLSVAGVMDTNVPADLSGASIQYSSDQACIVIDNPSTGTARAVARGTANITAAVTLDGVTRLATIPLTVDGTPPPEVTGLSGGLVNGEYRLTWKDPVDPGLSGIQVYHSSQLIGTAAIGAESMLLTGLQPGQSYTLTVRTVDTAGNVSAGTHYTFVYEAPNVLKEVTIRASKEVLKPGQSVSFMVEGKLMDGTAVNLEQASVTYTSSSGSIRFPSAHSAVADAVYAGSARVKAVVTLDGATRETPPVLVRVYPAAQDAYDTLRIKYAMKLTGFDPDEPYSLSDPDIDLIIKTQDANAKSYWDSMDKTAYTWADLKSTTKSAELATASSRLRTMSRQWATYGSIYYQNEELLHDIIEGWNQFYTTRYNENKSMYDNWFDWLVNVPNNINDSMVSIYEAIPYSQYPDLIERLNRSIDHFVPEVTRTGANRVYISKVLMLRGITGKDGAKIQIGSEGLSPVFRNVIEGDGFYDDGSFIQHDYFPYAGGYGKALLQDISETLWLVSGSPWDNTDSQKDNIFKWYFHAFEPNIYNGQLINAVQGREISRDYTFGGYGIVNALLLQAEMTGNPYAEKQKSAIKYHIQNSSVSSFLGTATIWNMQKARKLLNDPAIQAYSPPQGNYLFHNQDNVVHRGSNWLYSISMHSDRIANYETVSNENLKGWYEADGMTQLYQDPLDYLSTFWTTVDPSRLPGITVDRDENRPPATSNNRPYVDMSKYAGDGELMSNSWTGGVSMDRQYGTAGMDFKQHHYSDMDVSAKKSWFMFDDEIVALGAGINSSSDRTIETIVDNRTLNAYGDNKITVDGALYTSPMGQQSKLNDAGWIQLEGTGGYVFPRGAALNLLREERAGISKDINEKFFTPGYDDFNSATRSTFWGWIREDQARYSFTGSRLNIMTQQGTLLNDTNSTRNLLQTNTPKEDFYITTAVDFSPYQQGQEAGLTIRKDDDNYVSVSKGMTSQGSRIIAVNEIGGSAQMLDFPNPVQDQLFLKIDKSGDRYAVYASSNEKDWGAPLYTFTNPMAGGTGLT